jgi:hypothetical protein
MANEMIERVARAMENAYQCRACGALIRGERPGEPCCERPSWVEASPELKARAAIEAMREPTEDMVSEAVGRNEELGRVTAESAYRAMIDAALAEGTEAATTDR